MIYSGSIDYTLYQEDAEGFEQPLALVVDWTCEKTELGDGRKELDWDLVAKDASGNQIQLPSWDETQIMEQLINEGALA